MARIRIVLLFIFTVFLFVQEGLANIDEPKPVFQDLYVSSYEQKILLAIINNEEPEALQVLLANAVGMDLEKEDLFRSELSSFVQKMKKKKAKAFSDKDFLQTLFYKVHHKYLKEYQPYKNFYTLLESGAYNCLTGTAMYALLLDELGYTYQIFETDYHIFLLVRSADGQEILIESTDYLNGILIKKEEIDQRLEDIRKGIGVAGQRDNRNYLNLNLNIFRPITLQQLAGLQYFNQAAQQFNNHKVVQAELSLSKGHILYPAERFEKFSQFLAEQKK